MRYSVRPLAIAGLAVCTAAIGACTDAPTGPRAAWVAVETEAALKIEDDLPTLPRLIERVRSARESTRSSAAFSSAATHDRTLDRAGTLWRSVEHASVDDAEARRTRDRAYGLASEPLAASLDSGSVGRMRAELEAWVNAAGELEMPARFPDAVNGLATARSWLAHGRRAAGQGDRAAEMVALLQAAERIAELTPSAVARRLITRATVAADSAAERQAVSARTLRRAERLVAGARDALESGDAVRAIRRAFYATRLLDRE